MNRIVIAICLVFFLVGGSVCNAQTNPRKGIVFECVSPLDIAKGAGCYIFDTGDRVLRGVGDVVTAPFKAKICIPHKRRYFYRPGVWIPPTLKPLPKNKKTTPPLYIEPLPDVKRGPSPPLKLYQPLYYPPESNHSIAHVGK